MNSSHQAMTKELARDGEFVRLVELKNHHGMSVVLMDIGATWLSCQLPLPSGAHREVLLGVNSIEDFYRQSAYMGTTVGRYANRIRHGQFTIDGQDFQVSINQNGHCLHGGEEGFDQRRWQIDAQTNMQVTFSCESPSGDQGFPGTVKVTVTYTLTDDNAIKIEYCASSDQATPINLTNHAYFNLSGAESGLDCLSHYLSIAADQYLPTDAQGIPVGDLKSVQGTGFDFRHLKTIATDFLKDADQVPSKGYDHGYLFAEGRDKSQPVVVLYSPEKDVCLQVLTDKPAIQLYSGNWLAGTPSRIDEYQDHAGVALETQFLADSPNHPEWHDNDCILRPNQTYAFETIYRFQF